MSTFEQKLYSFDVEYRRYAIAFQVILFLHFGVICTLWMAIYENSFTKIAWMNRAFWSYCTPSLHIWTISINEPTPPSPPDFPPSRAYHFWVLHGVENSFLELVEDEIYGDAVCFGLLPNPIRSPYIAHGGSSSPCKHISFPRALWDQRPLQQTGRDSWCGRYICS